MPSEAIRTPPRQARSQQRVALILDTAADLFARQGYETVTTNHIAARAGISIGSLYRYFPDKEAILRALGQRYVAQTREIYDRVLGGDVVYLPLPVLVDRLIDPFVAMYLRYPIYIHILLGADTSAEIAGVAQEIRAEVVDRISGLIRQAAPDIPRERATLLAQVSNAAVKALISLLVATDDESFRARVTAEMKRMLVRYLEPELK